MENEQIKTHPNPLSKEGLAMSIAQIQTDLRWIKEKLNEMDEKLEEQKEYTNTKVEEVDNKVKELKKTVKELEQRVTLLEQFKSKIIGAVLVLSGILAVIGNVAMKAWEILKKIGG